MFYTRSSRLLVPPSTIFVTDHIIGNFVNVLPDWLIVILSLECYTVIFIDFTYSYCIVCVLYLEVRFDILKNWMNELYLYNKRRYVCPSVCLSVSMFRMAGQTAGPIETKLDTRTHVHPGSVSVKVNVKVIHDACGSDRITKHPERCAKATPGERLRNSVRTTGTYSSSNETRRRRRRAARRASRTPSVGRVG